MAAPVAPANTNLTQNGIPHILKNGQQEGGDPPVFQILAVKKLSPNQASHQTQERYKIIVNDGSYKYQAMLATPNNQLIYEGSLVENCLVALDEFTVEKIQNHTVIVVLRLRVVGQQDYQIGNPEKFDPNQHHEQKENSAPVAAAPKKAQTPLGQVNNNVKYEPSYSGPIARASEHKIHPVAALNPFLQNWMIKVRVTNKSDIRTWKNAKGEGSLFSCDLLDENGTEIRATFFKDAVDKFYDVVQEGKVYIMGGGRLKAANRRFTSIKNEYEITFDPRATIEACPDDENIENEHFDFVSISELEKMNTEDTTVDVIGIAKDAGELATISTRNGNEVDKRDLSLMDRSGSQIQVTLWGEHAQKSKDQLENAVVALKGVRLTDFNTRSLSTSRSSKVEINPDIPESHELRGWFDNGGNAIETKTLSMKGSSGGGGTGAITNVELRKTLAAIDDEQLGQSDKPDVILTKATITRIFANPDSPPWYPADPTLLADGNKSKKKLVEDPSRGTYISEVSQGPVDNPDWRYVLRVAISDATATKIVTLFDQEAEQLIGKPASEMRQILEESKASMGDSADGAPPKSSRFTAMMNEKSFTTWYFTLRIKQDMVKDENRLKVSVGRMREVDPVFETKALMNGINKLAVTP